MVMQKNNPILPEKILKKTAFWRFTSKLFILSYVRAAKADGKL